MCTQSSRVRPVSTRDRSHVDTVIEGKASVDQVDDRAHNTDTEEEDHSNWVTGAA